MNQRDTEEKFVADNHFDANATHVLRKTMAIFNMILFMSLVGVILSVVVYFTRLGGFWGLVDSLCFAIFGGVSMLAFAQRHVEED